MSEASRLVASGRDGDIYEYAGIATPRLENQPVMSEVQADSAFRKRSRVGFSHSSPALPRFARSRSMNSAKSSRV